MNRSERTPAERWVPWISLAWILLMTVEGLVRIPYLDHDLHFNALVGAIVVGLLLVIGVLGIVAVRLFVLTQASGKSDNERAILIGSSYMFAVAPSVYGLVVSLFTGKGLLTLPFSALALVGLALVWSYLKDPADAGA